METNDLLKRLQDGNIADVFDEGIKGINQDEETKNLIAGKIEFDIQQYIDSSWGYEKPIVKVIGDDAYVICFGRKMKPIMFYSCVFNNLGVVTKDLFVSLSEEYEDL